MPRISRSTPPPRVGIELPHAAQSRSKPRPSAHLPEGVLPERSPMTIHVESGLTYPPVSLGGTTIARLEVTVKASLREARRYAFKGATRVELGREQTCFSVAWGKQRLHFHETQLAVFDIPATDPGALTAVLLAAEQAQFLKMDAEFPAVFPEGSEDVLTTRGWEFIVAETGELVAHNAVSMYRLPPKGRVGPYVYLHGQDCVRLNRPTVV